MGRLSYRAKATPYLYILVFLLMISLHPPTHPTHNMHTKTMMEWLFTHCSAATLLKEMTSQINKSLTCTVKVTTSFSNRSEHLALSTTLSLRVAIGCQNGAQHSVCFVENSGWHFLAIRNAPINAKPHSPPPPPPPPPGEGWGFVTEGLQKTHPWGRNFWIILH